MHERVLVVILSDCAFTVILDIQVSVRLLYGAESKRRVTDGVVTIMVMFISMAKIHTYKPMTRNIFYKINSISAATRL